MSIPYNDNLSWKVYKDNPDWYQNVTPTDDHPNVTPADDHPTPAENNSSDRKKIVERAVNQISMQIFKEPIARVSQCIKDDARLILKETLRSILTPIILPKNWKQRERVKINIKLAGYSFVQLVSVPAKFCVAIAALCASQVSLKKAEWLLEKSDRWTAYFDGRASQLEALKEEGRMNATDQTEFKEYKNWLYKINPELCRKKS